jgi:hypothetical protein
MRTRAADTVSKDGCVDEEAEVQATDKVDVLRSIMMQGTNLFVFLGNVLWKI